MLRFLIATVAYTRPFF